MAFLGGLSPRAQAIALSLAGSVFLLGAGVVLVGGSVAPSLLLGILGMMLIMLGMIARRGRRPVDPVRA